jgi:hypothetical protein
MELGDGIGAIATLFAILGAFEISRDWRNQKGSEVVANEAKTVIYNLKKLSRYYYQNNYKVDRNTIKDVAKDGVSLIEDLIESLDFIYRSIDNRKDKVTILLFSRVLNSNFYSYKTILNINKTDSEIKDILKDINSKYNDNNKDILRLIVDYSLYKKTI